MSHEPRPGPLPLSDFGLYHVAHEPYLEAFPETLDDVIALVHRARDEGRRICVRGGSHSLHGGSVPRSGELLLRTERLRAYRFDSPHTITVGGGASLWDLHDMLARFGGRLPLVNNGSAGPTVGGFIAAGGLGADSDVRGGFWSNVPSLTVVDAHARVHRVTRDDPRFPWFFGALGQLGVVVEAELDVAPWDFHELLDRRFEGSTRGMDPGSVPHRVPPPERPGVLALPVGTAGLVERIHEVHEPRATLPGRMSADEMTYWVTLMAPVEREPEAAAALEELRARHAESIAFLPVFRYAMAHRGLVAPLVFPSPVDFCALFLWGKVPIGTAAGRRAVEALEEDFGALVLARGLHRYHQTEWVGPRFDLARYYGDAAWAHFGALREAHDPGGLFLGGHARSLGCPR
jgi:FAD/FMN-containing dehydrogenase